MFLNQIHYLQPSLVLLNFNINNIYFSCFVRNNFFFCAFAVPFIIMLTTSLTLEFNHLKGRDCLLHSSDLALVTSCFQIHGFHYVCMDKIHLAMNINTKSHIKHQ